MPLPAFSTWWSNKSGGTLTLSGSSDLNVTGDLSLTSGTMEDGGRTVNVTGNVTNAATHTSGTVGTGGISFTDANHEISGAGTFGNITLTGTTRTVTVNDAITLNADLDFTGTVVFDVLENGLTFGSSATITGSSLGDTKRSEQPRIQALSRISPPVQQTYLSHWYRSRLYSGKDQSYHQYGYRNHNCEVLR